MKLIFKILTAPLCLEKQRIPIQLLLFPAILLKIENIFRLASLEKK